LPVRAPATAFRFASEAWSRQAPWWLPSRTPTACRVIALLLYAYYQRLNLSGYIAAPKPFARLPRRRPPSCLPVVPTQDSVRGNNLVPRLLVYDEIS
jgi:hypothetical protein